jgi:hypothetical protein
MVVVLLKQLLVSEVNVEAPITLGPCDVRTNGYSGYSYFTAT